LLLRRFAARCLQGRVLNATARGYAVGVAGYVALLQRSQGQVQLTQRIGVLQDFYIHSMDSRRRQINLSNMARKQEDIYEDYKRTM
jgi:ribosomal protein S1